MIELFFLPILKCGNSAELVRGAVKFEKSVRLKQRQTEKKHFDNLNQFVRRPKVEMLYQC